MNTRKKAPEKIVAFAQKFRNQSTGQSQPRKDSNMDLPMDTSLQVRIMESHKETIDTDLSVER